MKRIKIVSNGQDYETHLFDEDGRDLTATLGITAMHWSIAAGQQARLVIVCVGAGAEVDAIMDSVVDNREPAE